MTQPESPTRRQQIKEVFADALDLAPEQRTGFLAQACAGDAELHAEVMSLLAAQESAGDFIAQPVLHLAAQHLAQEENSTWVQSPSAPTALDLALGTTLEQRYLIEKVLERGGISIVYLARDQKLHQTPVVIKVLQEAFTTSPQSQWLAKKFQEEIKALARVDHPNVVRVLDRGTLPDGRAFLVLQYVAGNNLRAAISVEGMELEHVGKLLRQIGQGLAAAHEKGIIHRDLKPENIMLHRDGGEEYVKLIDFGLATVQELTSKAANNTTQVAGTPAYMAPEQFQGRPISASDIYALGVTTYEMVTGRKPFMAESSYEMVEMQRKGVRVLPCDLRPNLPPAAQTVILKALSFAPADRYARAQDFSEAFVEALRQEPSNLTRVTPQPKKLRWLIATLLVSLLLVIAFFVRPEIFVPKPAPTPTPNAPFPTMKVSLGNGVSLELVQLPAGEFVMGSDDPRTESDERPQHPVSVNSFAIGRYEITQAQWKAVMYTTDTPSHFQGDNLPVENVSWDMVQDFIQNLRQKTGQQGFRLPTEKEWEYAARAGSTGDWGSGGRSSLRDFAWFTADASEVTHPVGMKKPNPWGLFDMQGNVMEYCDDWYDETAYQGKTASDKKFHVLRGGCVLCMDVHCRTPYRDHDEARDRKHIGFRVANP